MQSILRSTLARVTTPLHNTIHSYSTLVIPEKRTNTNTLIACKEGPCGGAITASSSAATASTREPSVYAAHIEEFCETLTELPEYTSTVTVVGVTPEEPPII